MEASPQQAGAQLGDWVQPGKGDDSAQAPATHV